METNIIASNIFLKEIIKSEKIIRPLMRVGETNDGRYNFKEEELKTFLKNTNEAIQDGHRVSIKLGHYDNNQISKGWVKNLKLGKYKDGNNEYIAIFGEFYNLVPEVLQAIKEDRLPQVSVEISPKFIKKNGEKIGNLLNSVALMGIDRPAIHFSSKENEEIDFKRLFKYFCSWLKKKKYSINNNRDKNFMEETMNFEEKYKEIITLNANLEADSIKLKAEFDVKIREITKLSEEIIKANEELKKLKAENDELKPVKEQMIKLEAEKFAEGLFSERKIFPAQKDHVLSYYIKNGKEESEKMFNNSPVIPEALFKEQINDKIDEKKDDELDKKVKELMGL